MTDLVVKARTSGFDENRIGNPRVAGTRPAVILSGKGRETGFAPLIYPTLPSSCGSHHCPRCASEKKHFSEVSTFVEAIHSIGKQQMNLNFSALPT